MVWDWVAMDGFLRPRLSHRQSLHSDVPKKSKLANLLLEHWAWGLLGASAVQVFASAAVQDGACHPDLNKLAAIGTSGANRRNCARDLNKY